MQTNDGQVNAPSENEPRCRVVRCLICSRLSPCTEQAFVTFYGDVIGTGVEVLCESFAHLDCIEADNERVLRGQ